MEGRAWAKRKDVGNIRAGFLINVLATETWSTFDSGYDLKTYKAAENIN